MQTKKTRIRWIDNARGICVFCVLLAHCKLEHTYLQMIYTPFFFGPIFLLVWIFVQLPQGHQNGYSEIGKKLNHSIFPLVFPACLHRPR